MGHTVSVKDIARQVKNATVPIVTATKLDCESCIKSKFSCRFKDALTETDRIGVIHTDTDDKINVPLADGHKYFLTVIGEYSRYTYICHLQSRADATDELLKFIKRFEKRSGHVARVACTDSKTKFKRALTVLDSQGVETSNTTVYNPS